jgi:hypothetical protein
MATNFSFEDASVPSTFSFEEAGVKQNKGIIGDIGTGIKHSSVYKNRRSGRPCYRFRAWQVGGYSDCRVFAWTSTGSS